MIHSSDPFAKRPKRVPEHTASTTSRAPRPAPKPALDVPSPGVRLVRQTPSEALDIYMTAIAGASSMELVELERHGVEGVLLKELARKMGITSIRLFAILGLPKATADKKAAAGERVVGSAGQAAIAVIKLNAKAQAIVANSTAPEAEGFDASLWLGRWIEVDQPALGGRKAADLLDTPTGQKVVSRLLGALESGAYQ